MLTPLWLLNADANLPNRLAWRFAALLAGTMALTAICLHQGYFEVLKRPAPPARSTPLAANTGQPSGIATNGEPVTDFQRRIEFCSQHVTTDRSFVVFANGTCAIVNEPTDDPIGNAIELISRCSGPDARFITRPIEADSYMVTYKEPVFHCLFADEVAQLAPVIDRSYDSFLAPAERLAQPAGWEPPFDAKLGLMARTFLNADAQNQRVVKVIRAMPVPEIDYTSAQASITP